ncbi:peptide-methionine (R)-S-oxide reductase [bacterium]|nr:peptide-methionine (R)-S-oxide reductase [bacterium]
MDKVEKSDEEWRKELTPEQYEALRMGGTEAAGTGSLYHNTKTGRYLCAACGNELFASKTKYDSGSGWPSFYEPVAADALEEKEDDSLGMQRTEVTCGKCGSHLGHVFDDGPTKAEDGTPATGLRYCVNSIGLTFEEDQNEK